MSRTAHRWIVRRRGASEARLAPQRRQAPDGAVREVPLNLFVINGTRVEPVVGKGGKLGSAGAIGVGRMSGVECIVADYVRAASEQHARCPASTMLAAQRALCSLPSEHMLAAPCPASSMLAVMWTSSAQHARCHVDAQLVAIWMLVVRLVSANIGPNAALPM